MTNKGNLVVCVRSSVVQNSCLVFLLEIEEVSLAEERLWDPPVGIQSVNSDGVLSPVDGNPLVETVLIEAKLIEKSSILIHSLDNLDRVCIDLLDTSNSGVSAV